MGRVFQQILEAGGKQADADAAFDRGDLKAYLKHIRVAQKEWFQGIKLGIASKMVVQGLDQDGSGDISLDEFSSILEIVMKVMSKYRDLSDTNVWAQKAMDAYMRLPGYKDGLSLDDIKKEVEKEAPGSMPYKDLVVDAVARVILSALDTDEEVEVGRKVISQEEWFSAVIEIARAHTP